jgi:WD40 repeat protein
MSTSRKAVTVCVFLAAVSASVAAPIRGIKLQARIQYSSSITAVAFSPDGRFLATGLSSGEIDIRHVSLNAIGRSLFRLHTGLEVNALAFSHDSRSLFAGGKDYLQKWGLARRRLLWKHRQRDYTYPPSYGRIPVTVCSLALSPKEDVLAGVVVIPGSCANGTEVRLWSNETGRLTHRLLGYDDPPYDNPNNVAFLDSHCLLIDCLDRVSAYDLRHYRQQWELKHVDLSSQLALSLDRRRLVCADYDRYEIWDIRRKRLVYSRNIEATYGGPSVSISRNSDLIATAADTLSGHWPRAYIPEKPAKNDIRYQIGLWNAGTGKLISNLPGAGWVAFSPRSDVLLTGEIDGIAGLTRKRMRVWRIAR